MERVGVQHIRVEGGEQMPGLLPETTNSCMPTKRYGDVALRHL